jgi:hypothetical protein
LVAVIDENAQMSSAVPFHSRRVTLSVQPRLEKQEEVYGIENLDPSKILVREFASTASDQLIRIYEKRLASSAITMQLPKDRLFVHIQPSLRQFRTVML